MRVSATATRPSQDRDLYDVDFFEWTQRTADLLRRGRFREMDVEHAAEEIEDMGKRDFREVSSRLQVLLIHLLKWQLQRRKRSRSWRASIATQRAEIEGVLEQSPSLRPRARHEVDRIYRRAVERAMLETGLPGERFPESCPFSAEQVFDPLYLPE